jgi:hypothetical protein
MGGQGARALGCEQRGELSSLTRSEIRHSKEIRAFIGVAGCRIRPQYLVAALSVKPMNLRIGRR